MERVIKKEIFIDKQNFAKDLEKYSSKIETEKAIKCAVKNILPKYRVTDKFYDNVMLNFYEAVASAYKSQNTMNIKPQQLLKILDIDTTEIERLSAKYNSLKDFKTPTIDAYTTYAENEKELKKLATCEKLLNTINSIADEVKIYPIDLEKAFSRIILFNIRTNKFEYNWRWIKDISY